MSRYISVPDGWTETRYEVGDSIVPSEIDDVGETIEEFEATYICDEHEIVVEITDSTDHEEGPFARYVVRVVQTLEADGYRDDVETHALATDDREQAEQLARSFMDDVNEDEHIIRCIETELWQSFVQFYCIDSSELPDNITADDVIQEIENDVDVANVADEESIEFDDEILVDVYPRPKDAVAEIGEIDE